MITTTTKSKYSPTTTNTTRIILAIWYYYWYYSFSNTNSSSSSSGSSFNSINNGCYYNSIIAVEAFSLSSLSSPRKSLSLLQTKPLSTIATTTTIQKQKLQKLSIINRELLLYATTMETISSLSSENDTISNDAIGLSSNNNNDNNNTTIQQLDNDYDTLNIQNDSNNLVNNNNNDDDDYDALQTANMIEPHTKTLTESIRFYANYVIKRIIKKRISNKKKKKQLQQQLMMIKNNNNNKSKTKTKTKTKKRWEIIKQLNEQRKNVIKLAGYKSNIIIPSFSFLTLGAIMTSIIPHYYSKCIQCISTLVAVTSGSSSTTTTAVAGAAVVAGTTGSKQLVQAITGLVITSILAGLFTGLRGSLFWISGTRANYNMRVKLHRSLLLQEAAFFDSNEVGYLLSRLNNDVNKVGNVISYHINCIFRQFVEFVIGSIFLFRISSTLAIYTLFGISIIAIISTLYGNFTKDVSEHVQELLADGTAVAETSFVMSETIRAFNGIKSETKKYELAQYNALNLEEVQAWAYGSHKFISESIETILSAILLITCYTYGINGKLSPAKLTSFMFYSKFVLESSQEVGSEWAKIQSAIGASTSVFDLIKRKPKVRDPQPTTSTSSKEITNGGEVVNENEENINKVIPSTTATAMIEFGNNTATTSTPITATSTTTSSSLSSTSSPLMVNPTSDNNNGVTQHHHQQQQKQEQQQQKQQQQPIISLNNMTITYGAMDRPALNNINLNIYPNDRIAIVGRSGSGKSSMLRTMLRFYDPTYGTVILDNDKNLKLLTRKQIARKISVVQQEPQVFPMSLMENVLYGMDQDCINNINIMNNNNDNKTKNSISSHTTDSTDSTNNTTIISSSVRLAVAECLRLSGLPVHPGNDLSLELDTRVGEGGRSLSGGQRQRIAIARAIIRSPDVLLLDEPTAALDSESEKKVVRSLQCAMEHTRSMVMVTHRLGVIRSLDVNRVIVLDKGEIVESGHPEELLQNPSSLYASLAHEQGIIAETTNTNTNTTTTI